MSVSLERKLVKMLKEKKFVCCADAGLGSFNIKKFNSMGGRAFVITQSIKKRPDVLKEAVFNDYDHRLRERKVAHLKELNKKSKIFLSEFPCYISKSHQGRRKRRGYAGYFALGFL